MKKLIYLLGCLSVLALLFSCTQPIDRKIVWRQQFQTLGTNSSPKCADLNGDGVLDVVMGAGKNEFESTPVGIIAMDGANGQVLWTVPVRDQMVGSAQFLHINGDSILDVVIGGRAAQLKAINGADGSIIWDFKVLGTDFDALGYMRFNFYHPQILPDLNQDGVSDLLVANGGNVRANPGEIADRYPGVLAIFSGKDGKLISAATLPDEKETYMSPLVHDFDEDGQLSILFGSGGETLGGSLYLAELNDLLTGDLSRAKRLIEKNQHGFIAPPCLVDVNQDGKLDIIANWHGGSTLAIDGQRHELLWEYQLPGSELSNSPCPGDVNQDQIPDFFSAYSLGQWPENTASVQVILNGKDGSVLYQDTLGCAGYASGLSYDLNGDGASEFIWNSNEYNCNGLFTGTVTYRLYVLDYAQNRLEEWQAYHQSKNISSSPWLGDLDQNDKLDLVFCVQAHLSNIERFYGFRIERMEMNIAPNLQPAWTEYIGPSSIGKF